MSQWERQREGDQHAGIISGSVGGLGRNAGVWHTRMWSCAGLVSLVSPSQPLVCSTGAHQLPAHIQHVHSGHITHLPVIPSYTYTHASQVASPSSHVEVFSGWYSWSMRQFLWIFHLGCHSRTNPVSFSSWLEIMNTVFFPDDVIVPYTVCVWVCLCVCVFVLLSLVFAKEKCIMWFWQRFTNHLLCLCLFLYLSCRSEFDLDYDSYHDDYYDRYCQKAMHGSSHTLLLVCVSQEAKERD